MNETTALGPMFTALNAPIDEMNQTLTNRTMYDVKYWSCKEDFRGLDFSSLSQNDRVTRFGTSSFLVSYLFVCSHQKSNTHTQNKQACVQTSVVWIVIIFFTFLQHSRSHVGMFSWNRTIRFRSFSKEKK